MDWLPPEIPVWAVLVGIGVLGLIIGLLIGRISGSRASAGGKAVKQLKQEHQNYKQDVTLHFEQTGQLLQTMTEQYKALHDHLAHGSADFSSDENGLFPTLGHDSEASTSEQEKRVEPTLEETTTAPETVETKEVSMPNLPPDVPAAQDDAESQASISITQKPATRS